MSVKQVFNTSAELDLPNVLPTLDLDFANSKTLDPRVTFTRSSGGSYVGADGLIKYAGVNEPRFDHNPATGESLGLLIEEQRTNLFTTSEDFNPAIWGGGGTSNTDTILNPYGVLGTVYYITTSEKSKTFNANGYSTLALSFFSKKRFGGLERDYTRIEIFQVAVGGGALQSYNFQFNGNNPDGPYVKDIKTEEYPNGWYRFSCRLVARADYNSGTFATISRFDIEGSESDNYVWGVQVEPASFATSYIPTQGSTRTRAQDIPFILTENNNWYNPNEGTLLIDTFKGVPNPSSGFSATLVTSGQNYIGLDYTSTDFFCGASYWRNNPTASEILTLFPQRVYPSNGGKYVAAYKINDFAATAVGGPVTEIRPTQPVPTANRIYFGGQTSNSFIRRKIHFRRLTYFPKRLPNSQLISLTI